MEPSLDRKTFGAFYQDDKSNTTSVVGWSDNLLTKNKTIDQQHRQLLEHIESLIHSLESDENQVSVEELFGFLELYTLHHFQVEEELMEEYEYPYYTEHLIQHHRFQFNIEQLWEEYERGGDPVHIAYEMREQLMDWFVNHIQHTDQRLARFLRCVV
jgi:hemerythrin